MVKIVQFIASSGMGGAEKFVLTLCNNLAKKGLDIHLLLPKQSPMAKLADQKVQLHTIQNSMGRYNPLFYLELYKLIKKLQPHIIHTHSAKATEVFYRLRWLHNSLHVATKHNGRKGAIFEHIKHVIGVSSQSVNSIKKSQATLIHNGIEPANITTMNAQNPTFSLLCVGRLDPIKGYDKLINICQKLPFPYELEIIGDGPWRKTLQLQIQNLNLQKSIKLTGFSHNIPQKMQQADVVILPSISEGFSLVMIEALFYSKLLIATPVGGAKEILHPEFLSTHENLQQKLEDVYQNYHQYKQNFATLAHELRPKLTMNSCAQEHIKLYKRLKESDAQAS